jgi:hypothetical protein
MGGVLSTIFKTEKIGEHEIGTALLSSGEYAATVLPNGLLVRGTTREEALSKLREQLDSI